jgi:hypothetical protein
MAVMDSNRRVVSTTSELIDAVATATVRHILIDADLADVPTLNLLPGQCIAGVETPITVRFARRQDGLMLSRDNEVNSLKLITDPERRAIFNRTDIDSLGRIALGNLDITVVVQILARDKVREGHIEAHGIDIVAADARHFDDRPQGYGVGVVQGAFTLWNQQTDPALALTADLTGLCAGRPGAPVRGSGIFVGGAGDVGGRVVVTRLETGAVYSDGGIARGTHDCISGGVLTVYGAVVDCVHNTGPVTTYGPNDMVLDNWGLVDRWVAEERITSYGPSGIGFVNFGTLTHLEVKAPIETFGQGARGFNVYSGTVRLAEFERVVTHADGAVGIQISQPVGRIVVRRGVETYGGAGDSLVKGVVMKLAATALSIKPGASVHAVEIDGGLLTHGHGIAPLEMHGAIDSLRISGNAAPLGGGFETL